MKTETIRYGPVLGEFPPVARERGYRYLRETEIVNKSHVINTFLLSFEKAVTLYSPNNKVTHFGRFALNRISLKVLEPRITGRSV